MKNFRQIILIVLLGSAITACHFGRHTTIIENGNGHYLRIESYGRVYFNRDGTGISYISHGGYLQYRNNDRELRAENDHHGGIKYELTEDGRQLNTDSNRAFIAEAVRIMIAKGYHSN
ncbi:MAG: hypothetical protein JSU01_19650 [Bacteroidetes bacterium]|nr:hypothetical protein [Bacteroidota bacterium]